MSVSRYLSALALSIACCALSTPSRAAECDRTCLKELADLYLDSLAKHDPHALPLAEAARFTENGALLWPGEGLWQTAGLARYRVYALDPQSGQVAVEAVVPEGGNLVNFLLRLKVEDRKITEVETILCRNGGAALHAPDKLVTPPALFAEPVAAAERATRGELLATANAYFQAIETEGTPVYQPGPFVPETKRVENGVQTTNASIGGNPPTSAAQQLDMAVFKGIRVIDRRYPVVDVENGLVLGIVMFDERGRDKAAAPPAGLPKGPDGPLLLAEMFKVSAAKIREIQAVMVNRPHGAPTGWN